MNNISTAVKTLTDIVGQLKNGRIDRPEDVCFWCLGILRASPGMYVDWSRRKPYRATLQQPRQANKNAEGRRAISDLVQLTISDLESGYRDSVDLFNLPGVTAPKTLSAEHKAKILDGRRRARQARADQLAEATDRRVKMVA